MPSLPQLNLPSISPPSFSVPDLSPHKKILLLAVLGIILVVLLVVFLVSLLFRTLTPTTVTYWGLWEDQNVFQQVISDYKRSHPNVTVKYLKQSPINYRERALTALAKDDGPDIVRLHNAWLPMFKNLVAVVPKNIFSAESFRDTFYPVALKDLTIGSRPYAIPLGIDTLALFVNQDLFSTGGASLPSTWDEFRQVAAKLTVRDTLGKIRTAGAALGTASNVDHWQDILALMMLQAGVDITVKPDAPEAAEALNYYVTFATVDRVWDETLDPSTLAFAQGKLAMYFAPSWRFFDLKALNPDLNFKVIPVPQLTGGSTVNFASYWAEVVSKKSKNSQAAFEFLKYLSDEESLTKLYFAQSKLRAFGQPYPRVKMATLLSSDPNVGPFIAAAPTAQSSYLVSFTSDGDTGLNSRIAAYYRDAINSMLRGSDAASALTTVASGVTQVLGSYGLVPLPQK